MKLETLDLHAIKHSDVDDQVRCFLNFANLPVKIVTGKSRQMRNIVISIIEEYKYSYHFESAYNFGSLIVSEAKYRSKY